MYSISVVLLLLFGGGPVSDPVTAARPDTIRLAQPGEIQIGGFPGYRFELSRQGRLKHIPMDILMGGYNHRPGSQAWIGEHIGKWLHSAVVTWQMTGDEELKRMADKAVKDLLATQKPDGYLGTYEDKDRWTSWDVWVHKNNIIGLLTYYHATGDAAAFKAARRIGDLLVETFGPNKKDIIASGDFMGMAATAALEPMVWLYRATGDERYLIFCNYLVESWDQPHGPKIISGLLQHKKVNRLPCLKAYELILNLVGLCEFYRFQPNEEYLRAAEIAWEDIRKNQMYVTGGVSFREHFQPDGHLPDVGDVAETCANVAWLQLCINLLEITGKARYAEAAELLIYNHLLGAQHEDGEQWCYYTYLAGRKPFDNAVKCCQSSGPYGLAFMPSLYYGVSTGSVCINLLGESKYHGQLEGTAIGIEQKTDYPADGRILIHVDPEKPIKFGLEIRIPAWSTLLQLFVNNEKVDSTVDEGVVSIKREWHSGDQITLDINITSRWIRGQGEHQNMLAAARGPFILCANVRRNMELFCPELIAVDEKEPFAPAAPIRGARGKEREYSTTVKAKYLTPTGFKPVDVMLTPYAIGMNEPIRVWLATEKSLMVLDQKAEAN